LHWASNDRGSEDSGLATSAAVHQPTHRTQTAWVLKTAAVSTGHCSCWLLTLETLQHAAHSAADRTQFTALKFCSRKETAKMYNFIN